MFSKHSTTRLNPWPYKKCSSQKRKNPPLLICLHVPCLLCPLAALTVREHRKHRTAWQNGYNYVLSNGRTSFKSFPWEQLIESLILKKTHGTNWRQDTEEKQRWWEEETGKQRQLTITSKQEDTSASVSHQGEMYTTRLYLSRRYGLHNSVQLFRVHR